MNESLIKYLSGLIDADGSISFSFRSGQNKPDQNYLTLTISLATSSAVDVGGAIKRICEESEIGSYHVYGDKDQFASWMINKRAHVEMFLPRIIKHMAIKARHAQRMIEKWREKRGVPLTESECDALRLFAKESRFLDPGPLKAKNHPTWAWLAGYLDGDGCYSLINATGSVYKGKRYPQTILRVSAAAHIGDSAVLQFLQNAFGGNIRDERPGRQLMIWTRNLGPADADFALKFLPKLSRHSLLKRHKIDQMIAHHRQRLSAPSPAG